MWKWLNLGFDGLFGFGASLREVLGGLEAASGPQINPDG